MPTRRILAAVLRLALGSSAGATPLLLSGRLARDALVLCHRECESVRTGRAVAVELETVSRTWQNRE